MWPNWVDLLVLTILFIRCYNGFQRGLFTEGLRLTGDILLTLLVVNYSQLVAGGLESWLSLPSVVTAWVVFWGLLVVGALLLRWGWVTLATRLKWERIHWTTQAMGLALGAVQGLWWSGILLLGCSTSGIDYLHQSVMDRSLLAPYVLPIAQPSLERLSDRFPGKQYRAPTLIPPLKESE